jgi:hypothetical protein
VQNHLKENKSFDNFSGMEFFYTVFRKDRINTIYSKIEEASLPHELPHELRNKSQEEKDYWYKDNIANEIFDQRPDKVYTYNCIRTPRNYEDIPNLTFNAECYKKINEYLPKLQKYLKDIQALRIKSLHENNYKLHNLEDFYQEVKLELNKIFNIVISMYDIWCNSFAIKDKNSATKFIQDYEALTKKFNKKNEWNSIYWLYKTYLEGELTKIKATLEAKSINYIKL